MTLTILNLLFQITLLLSLPINPSAEEQSPPPLTNPHCSSKCGSVTIPFPFGIEPGCFIEEHFAIDCNSSGKPFLRNLNLEVLEISLQGTLRINHEVFFTCENNQEIEALDLTLTPFVYSSNANKFTALGCNNLAFMSDEDTVFGGCFSTCNTKSKNITEENGCYGIKCCQTKVPSSLQRFNISVRSLDYEEGSGATQKGCKYAFLVDQDWFETNFTNHQHVENLKHVPVVLDWGILRSSFDRFAMDKPANYKSSSNCSIFSTNPFPLVQCNCSKGFEGNPYLLQGCQDIDECKASMCGPTEICENINGSHYCYARPPLKRSKIIKLVIIGFGTSLGSLILLIGAWWFCIIIKERKEEKRKEKFFKKNGGLLLEKRLTSEDGSVDRSKLFNSKDLDKATDHFNVNRIVGEGGQGTVYKGMLSDGRIVAVKKSKIVDDNGKLQEFVNEVVILSKIKHRNVVELLGYCLETEVPLLVYEYIPNGTLSEYIHDPREEFPPLTWDTRLRIATEVVDALSYLHSAASMAIYHRDIKSANILLDSKYRAKVADFGISKSIEIDQTHATTKVVKGTIGYMDPEYFQSRHFTDKSDVYSFGVVLLELLTGQKPISEGKSLVHKFFDSMKENHLDNILNEEVKNQGEKEEIMIVAILAYRCLNLDGTKRPSMKKVSLELQRIRAPEKNNFQLNYEEIENMRSEVILPWDVTSTSTGSTFDNISPSTEFRALFHNIGANSQ